jgi:hypothetical protein
MPGITRILGVYSGKCLSYGYHRITDAGQQSNESRQRSTRPLIPLCHLIENIGTLNKLIVHLPACYTYATEEGGNQDVAKQATILARGN